MSHLSSEISSIYIKSLELKNFRRHKHTLLVFEKDSTNIILGENGVGKSTIFIGIIYALFGTDGLTLYERGRTKRNLIKRGEHEARVKLDLGVIDINGKEYTITIERILNSFSDTERAIVKVNNSVVCSGSERVKNFVVNELFKTTTKELIELIYARQGELGNYIKKLYTVETANFLDKILQLDKLSNLIEISRQKSRELNRELLNIKETIRRYSEDYERLKQNLISYYDDKSEITIEYLIHVKEYKTKLREILNRAKELYIRVQELNTQIDNELLAKEDEIKTEISKISEEIKKLENEKSEIYKELSSLHQQLPKINSWLREVTVEINKSNIEKLFDEAKNNFSESKIHELQSKIKEIENDMSFIFSKTNFDRTPWKYNINKIEEEIKICNDELEKLASEKAIIMNKINETKELLELIKKGELEKCPICESDIKDKYYEIVNKKENELKELKNKLLTLESSIKDYKKKLNELEKLYENLKYIMVKYNVSGNIIVELYKIKENIQKEFQQQINYGAIIYYKIKDQISKKEEILKEYDTRLNEIKKRKYILETQLKEIEKMKNIKQTIDKFKKEIYECAKLADINFDENEPICNIIKKIEDEYNRTPEIDEAMINTFKFYLEKIDKYKEQEKEVSSKINTLNQSIKIYEELRTLIRSYFVKSFSAVLTYWFKKLYIYPDIASVEINIEEGIRSVQNVYVLYVKFSDGSKKDIREAGLSGGQLVALELAFRLALINLLLNRVRFILLDEPTHSLDENVRIKLTEIMKEFKDFQIIACTHDEIFKEAASGKCYYLKRDDENNTHVETLN